MVRVESSLRASRMLIFSSDQLFRLLQQLPKSEMIKTVECWAKLVYPLLVSSAIKVHVVRRI